eukprot:1141547-Pelagomonas_calceolata.AAC.1
MRRVCDPGCYCWSFCCDWARWRKGVAGTAPVFGITFGAVGACAAGTAAAVCVGGGAGITAAAAGKRGLQSRCLSCCSGRTALRCRKGLPGLGRRPAGRCWLRGREPAPPLHV